MEQYYMFGAGRNGSAVIQFFGRQNIMAVVDNDKKKQGTQIDGIPVISLQEYIKKGDNRTIIITGFYDSESIIEDLNEYGISNYFVSPYMQNGYYKDFQDIVSKLELSKYEKLFFCTENPISKGIEQILKKENKKIEIHYIDKENVEKVTPSSPVLISNATDKLNLHRVKNIEQSKLLDINEVYGKYFGHKNEKIKKFKDIHKNKRCFVIGNGPSLSYKDLEKLDKHNETCFGVNRIYRAYPYTKWRPDYYVAADYMIIQKESEKILKLEGTKFIRHSYKFVKEWDESNTYTFKGVAYPPGSPQISFDMYQGIYMGNTVVYDTIQIALYMGFREIYLLGVDMTSGIRAEDENAHFYKPSNPNEVLGKGKVELARKCLGYAAKEIEKSGRILRNATRGGELEEVPRINFDSLFEK